MVNQDNYQNPVTRNCLISKEMIIIDLEQDKTTFSRAVEYQMIGPITQW